MEKPRDRYAAIITRKWGIRRRNQAAPGRQLHHRHTRNPSPSPRTPYRHTITVTPALPSTVTPAPSTRHPRSLLNGGHPFKHQRTTPSFRQDRRNPDAKDGKFTDLTMPRLESPTHPTRHSGNSRSPASLSSPRFADAARLPSATLDNYTAKCIFRRMTLKKTKGPRASAGANCRPGIPSPCREFWGRRIRSSSVFAEKN